MADAALGAERDQKWISITSILRRSQARGGNNMSSGKEDCPKCIHGGWALVRDTHGWVKHQEIDPKMSGTHPRKSWHKRFPFVLCVTTYEVLNLHKYTCMPLSLQRWGKLRRGQWLAQGHPGHHGCLSAQLHSSLALEFNTHPSGIGLWCCEGLALDPTIHEILGKLLYLLICKIRIMIPITYMRESL